LIRSRFFGAIQRHSPLGWLDRPLSWFANRSLLEREMLFSFTSGDVQMKRIVSCALSTLIVAGFLSVIGCDSGGIETGIPANTDKSQGVPADQLPKLAPIIPPGTKKKDDGKGATTPTPTPEAVKESTPK
jgi:hypothetical protein